MRSACSVKFFGAQRVALGSDYPFPLGEANPGRLIEIDANSPPKRKRQLLSGTRANFLGLD